MSPSAKKRSKSGVASKIQAEEPQDIRRHPVNKTIERTRLKTVLKNLSLLKLLKSPNPRIQELYNLAKRCWYSLFRVPKILINSRDNSCSRMTQNKKLQEAECPKEKPKSKKLEYTEEPKEMKLKKAKAQVGSEYKAKRSPEAVQQNEQMRLEVPRTSRSCYLTPGARRSQAATRGPQVVFLKNYHLRTPTGDMKQEDAAGQWFWFEGLPTRIHLPGPRVMCRASTLRSAKRCCTRYCSAKLKLPMCHPCRA
ncbi:PREDICTED: TP53-target gene 5 protein [Chrysochloris asiatica]|uniref:TP53-target gene 5 protein n=1 Tax=Chrysochloris asiatica TaxID=185453 RepID=A0A9B0TDD1_CHRAS|nr:PREDICTED: TP53-target gene 5 protein [Chrysochloris asiatica]